MYQIILALQIVAANPYATPALRDLIDGASRANRAPPPALRGYHATAESEVALLLRRTDASEMVAQVEQTQSTLQWSRNGDFEQRVEAYRAQAIGLNLSALSYFRQSWVVPVLYGDRLSILFGAMLPPDSSTNKRRKPEVIAIHPLSRDRDAYYLFSGGDTVLTMRLRGRDIPIARVLVEPALEAGNSAPAGVVLFRGEVDLDATRLQIVRMRGQLVRLGKRPRRAMGVVPVIAVAFVELQNAEVSERYWLPSYQRVELQASSPSVGEGRSVIRIITHVRDLRPDEDARLLVSPAADDTLCARPHYLRVAPRDSLGPGNWEHDLGAETALVHADDFEDVGPDRWRPKGVTRLDFQVERFADFLHFSPIEGVYSGYGAVVHMRDAVPGLVLRAHYGWAWAEETVRGRVSAELARGQTQTALRAGRGLDVTNDFRPALDSGPLFEDLFGSRDDRDYVDRRFVTGSLARRFGPKQAARMRLETGVVSDASARRHVSRGLVPLDSGGFRQNRGIAPGRYLRNSAVLDINPDVNGEMMNRGAGGMMMVERGSGDLAYTRVETRISLRVTAGATTLAARLDAGALFGKNAPPQQLFEMGGDAILPAYAYKLFSGDRAAAFRVLALRGLPVMRSPTHLWGRWYLPAPAPALTVSARVAMVNAVEQGTSAALLALGAPVQSSEGWRASGDYGIRFFGGAIGVVMARALDHRSPWKLKISFAQEL